MGEKFTMKVFVCDGCGMKRRRKEENPFDLVDGRRLCGMCQRFPQREGRA